MFFTSFLRPRLQNLRRYSLLLKIPTLPTNSISPYNSTLPISTVPKAR